MLLGALLLPLAPLLLANAPLRLLLVLAGCCKRPVWLTAPPVAVKQLAARQHTPGCCCRINELTCASKCALTYQHNTPWCIEQAVTIHSAAAHLWLLLCRHLHLWRHALPCAAQPAGVESHDSLCPSLYFLDTTRCATHTHVCGVRCAAVTHTTLRVLQRPQHWTNAMYATNTFDQALLLAWLA